MPHKTWVSWSSGKDSAFALHELKKQGDFEITGLMTTITETFERVAMHAVREALLIRQAEELELPLHRINLPHPCSNDLYEQQMFKAIAEARRQNVTHMMFGDLFLEDIRQYRERMLEPTGHYPHLPHMEETYGYFSQRNDYLWFQSYYYLCRSKETSSLFCGQAI